MRKGHSVLLSLFAVGCLATAASAHPVSYQGALSLMTWNQPYSTDYWVTYTYLRQAAIAGRAMRMTMKDGSDMRLYLPQADFLLFRKNAPAYQSNLYVFGGYGREEMAERTGGAGVAGFEADAESRKYYVSLMGQGVYPELGPDVYSTTFRVGAAAYPAEFDDLGTWFILQYQSNPQLARRHDVTPMVRLMYRNMLAEVGSGFSGDWLINFMVHF